MTQILQTFEVEIHEKGEAVDCSEEDKKEDFESQETSNIIVADATVAPQEIPYPTDHNLVLTARVQSENIID